MGVKLKDKALKKWTQKSSEYESHLMSSEITASMTQEEKIGEMVMKKEKIQTLAHATIPAEKLIRLEVQGGRTVNLGDYNSGKFSVSLSVPCTKDDLTDAYDWATSWVSEKITEAVKGMTADGD